MATVREATLELFRAHEMTTIFGNPGSTELPMLADLPVGLPLRARAAGARRRRHGRRLRPGDGPHDARQPAHRTGRRQRGRRHLQRPVEQVAAAGHGRPAGPRPDHDGGEPDQPRRRLRARSPTSSGATSRRARRMCPPRSRARSTTPRCRRAGPAFVSIPMDDWGQEADEQTLAHTLARSVGGRAVPDPAVIAALAVRIADGAQPRDDRRARTSKRPAAGTTRWRWRSASGSRCWRRPRPAAAGSASPRTTPTSRACWRPRSGRPASS